MARPCQLAAGSGATSASAGAAVSAVAARASTPAARTARRHAGGTQLCRYIGSPSSRAFSGPGERRQRSARSGAGDLGVAQPGRSSAETRWTGRQWAGRARRRTSSSPAAAKPMKRTANAAAPEDPAAAEAPTPAGTAMPWVGCGAVALPPASSWRSWAAAGGSLCAAAKGSAANAVELRAPAAAGEAPVVLAADGLSPPEEIAAGVGDTGAVGIRVPPATPGTRGTGITSTGVVTPGAVATAPPTTGAAPTPGVAAPPTTGARVSTTGLAAPPTTGARVSTTGVTAPPTTGTTVFTTGLTAP